MVQTKEEKNEYNRLRYQKNKEEILKKQKIHHLKNKEEKYEKQRLYRLKNKEEIKGRIKLWQQTPNGIKSQKISHWKLRNVFDHFNDKYETLWKIYQSTKFCENCNVELNIEGDYRTRKCLDHCHASGYFRNILCHSCNVRRG